MTLISFQAVGADQHDRRMPLGDVNHAAGTRKINHRRIRLAYLEPGAICRRATLWFAMAGNS